MLGRNHALLAALGWLAAAPAVSAAAGQPLSAAEMALGTLVCAGAGVLPDIDHPDASAARTFGPGGRVVAYGVRAAAGGHRQRTHTPWFALLAGAIAYGAVRAGPLEAGLVVAVCVTLAVRLVGPSLGLRVPVLVAIPIGAGAGYLAVEAVGLGGWLPGAVAAGCLLHLLGDIVTPEGVPLLWPLPGRVRLPLFHTGSGAEQVVGVLLLVGVAWFSWQNFGSLAPAVLAL